MDARQSHNLEHDRLPILLRDVYRRQKASQWDVNIDQNTFNAFTEYLYTCMYTTLLTSSLRTGTILAFRHHIFAEYLTMDDLEYDAFERIKKLLKPQNARQ